ncbi:MAG TPA: glycosyltransferase family 39 protein, partial [Vicinamibacteria bacterium]|nr:glycosyltransferase family 39 protein [Vicinamibacteria bacterium]
MRGERALLVVVFVVSAALRVVAVDRPLDMDEALWVQRGGAFFGALLEGRLAATYLRPHPGVISMWVLGVADLGWCRATADPAVPQTWRTCANRVAAEPFPSLPFFIVGRCLQALLTSGAVAAICLLAGRIFGARVGWLAAAILALEPFFVGFQRFVTTDALSTDLAALAWLLFLRYLSAGGRARLVLSGVAFGMA